LERKTTEKISTEEISMMTNNEKGKERIAKKTIGYLEKYGLGCHWDLDGDPSPDVALLIFSYYFDGDTAKKLGTMACRYLMRRIAQDHPGLKVPSSPSGVSGGGR
jgi:hypothetical protein